MGDEFKNLDYSKLKTYSIQGRHSKVDVKDFSTPWEKGKNFSDFLDSLPSILAGNDLRSVISAVSVAAKDKHQVCFAMGGHVIKTGMSPIVIDLMEKNIFVKFLKYLKID